MLTGTRNVRRTRRFTTRGGGLCLPLLTVGSAGGICPRRRMRGAASGQRAILIPRLGMIVGVLELSGLRRCSARHCTAEDFQLRRFRRYVWKIHSDHPSCRSSKTPGACAVYPGRPDGAERKKTSGVNDLSKVSHVRCQVDLETEGPPITDRRSCQSVGRDGRRHRVASQMACPDIDSG
jgi:hypothetical protein